MPHRCPACAYPHLTEPPRSKSGGGSYEICPSCGFQFGVTDDDQGITPEQWRERWKSRGMTWSSTAVSPPKGWNPVDQLSRLPAAPRKRTQ